MMHKRRVITSWPISFFWVFLSVTMAILATYSFLQADWVIKRNLFITNYYSRGNDTLTPAVTSTHSPVSSRHRSPQQESGGGGGGGGGGSVKGLGSRSTTTNHSHLLHLLLENYGRGAAGESRAGTHVRRAIKVTKLVTTVRFGTIGVCSSVRNIVQCRLYSLHDPHTVSSIWAMVTIIGGSGCMTLCVSAVLSLLAVALPSSQLRHQVAATIGHAQTVAVVLLFMSLLLFPLGFDSDFVRHHCGPYAGPYNIADCEIGWAYALVLVCASLALYCPVLVKFTADIRFDSLPKYL